MNDGNSVDILPTGVTAFVGPNNAGKSRLLREVQGALGSDAPPVVISGVEIDREGTQEEFDQWLSAIATRRFLSGQEHFMLEGKNIQVNQSYRWFQAGPPLLGGVHSFLVRLLDAESRLSLSSATTSFNALDEPPTSPLQRMFLDPTIEILLSDASREAFGNGVVLNRMGGSRIGLHAGDPLAAGITNPTDYLNEIAVRPPIQEQGDGIRSYLGILLAALATPWPVLLIDEPEAFLHPPQARALGRELAKIAAHSRQIILATHSADVIRGLLDGPAGSVSLNRLTRDGEVNHVASLPAEQLQGMWSDPLLRFSNIIDSLFHTTTVVCESDADCRYYEAVLASLVQSGAVGPRDWLFVHCGGKHRIPLVVSALKAAGVPVRVIADIDVLREEQPLTLLMDLFGIAISEQEGHLSAVRAAVQAQNPQNPVGYVRDQLAAIFNRHEGSTMTPQLQTSIREATKSADGWSMFKRGGVAWLPQGQATNSCEILLERLSSEGLHVVPVGELERWDAGVPGHGPGWVTAALEGNSHSVEGSSSWEFILKIASQTNPAT